MHHALRCAIALAEYFGEPQPDWELAADQLGHAVACHPEAFADKSQFSMDWYYPVLGGPLRGDAARDRLAAGWDTFVVPGLGVRCVSDQPWVTGAETCELALALDAIGDHSRALDLFEQIQHLRGPDGSYWTGWQFANRAHFPNEQSSWTAAAIVLAADAHVRGDRRVGDLRRGRGAVDRGLAGGRGRVRLRGPRARPLRRSRLTAVDLADPGAGALQHPERALPRAPR